MRSRLDEIAQPLLEVELNSISPRHTQHSHILSERKTPADHYSGLDYPDEVIVEVKKKPVTSNIDALLKLSKEKLSMQKYARHKAVGLGVGLFAVIGAPITYGLIKLYNYIIDSSLPHIKLRDEILSLYRKTALCPEPESEFFYHPEQDFEKCPVDSGTGPMVCAPTYFHTMPDYCGSTGKPQFVESVIKRLNDQCSKIFNDFCEELISIEKLDSARTFLLALYALLVVILIGVTIQFALSLARKYYSKSQLTEQQEEEFKQLQVVCDRTNPVLTHALTNEVKQNQLLNDQYLAPLRKLFPNFPAGVPEIISEYAHVPEFLSPIRRTAFLQANHEQNKRFDKTKPIHHFFHNIDVNTKNDQEMLETIMRMAGM